MAPNSSRATASYEAVSTAFVVGAVGVASAALQSTGVTAFVGSGPSLRQPWSPLRGAATAPAPAASEAALGAKSLMAFGASFGVLSALTRRSRGKAARKAEEGIAVKEEAAISKLAYLEKVPKGIIREDFLEKIIAATPEEILEDPPEESTIDILKVYAEVYGDGKTTKMGWWDFFYLKNGSVLQDLEVRVNYENYPELMKAKEAEYRTFVTGEVPLSFPLGMIPVDSGITLKWRGPEYWAGDQVREPLTDVRFSRQFIENMAFYREGLKPWQRGLEIGIAHGYFIIGPFVSLGPLRNTPEAATVGLLAGCACIVAVSVGGLIFGTTIKPTRFDKPGDAPAAGFNEMINWHLLGGLGGAGFAHALLTVFAS